MFTYITQYMYKYILVLKNKLYFPNLLAKIFNKSNINRAIIIFIIGFISRILVCHIYGINVYSEYLNEVSLTYYGLMAVFVVTISEIVSYFELNIIPSFIIDYYYFTLNVIIKVFNTTFNLLFSMGKSISYINSKIYLFLTTKDISIKDIKLSSLFTEEKKLTIGCVNLLSDKDDVLNKNSKPNVVKISNIVTKGSYKGEKLLPKTYNPNETTNVGESSKSSGIVDKQGNKSKLLPIGDNASVSNKSNPTVISKDSYTPSEVGFPSSTVRVGEDIILPIARPDSNISNQEYNSNTPYPIEGDFPLYDYSDCSNLQTPSTMPPLFDKYPDSVSVSVSSSVYYTPKETNTAIRAYSNHFSNSASFYYPSIASNSVASDSVTRNIGHARQGTYPAHLVVRPFGYNIAPTSSSSSSSNFYREEINSLRASVQSMINGEPENVANNSNNNIRPVVDIPGAHINNRHPSYEYYSRGIGGYRINRILPNPQEYPTNMQVPTCNSSNDPCSPNYISKHRGRFEYEQTQVRAKMQEEYNNNVEFANQEVILKQGKWGKIKLEFKALGGKFSNGISKIDSLYLHYKEIGKRHLIWAIIEEDSNNFESYQDFKKSWDSNTDLWDEIKKKVKNDIKGDIEGILGMKINNGVITSNNGNRLIDDLIERKRELNRRKPNILRTRDILRTSDTVIMPTTQEQSVNVNVLEQQERVNSQEESSSVQDEDRTKHKHRKHHTNNTHKNRSPKHGHRHVHKESYTHTNNAHSSNTANVQEELSNTHNKSKSPRKHGHRHVHKQSSTHSHGHGRRK